MNGLITAHELRNRLPDVAVADVRWYLAEPARGLQEYLAGHIPGAVYVDLERDLSAPDGPGRHPMPTCAAFAGSMGHLGFGDADFVVAYDDRGGVIAARLWWMLRSIGHDRVAVLDGGIQAWVAAGGTAVAGEESRSPTVMSTDTGPTRVIDRGGLAGRLGSVRLLDSRSGERYRGEEEPVDPVAGHIPTALSVPTEGNLDNDGRFLPPGELHQRFAPSMLEETVVYCGSGVTACHNALAMHIAGLPEPVLYPGSWSDWSTAGMPVATGPEPGQA